MSFLKLLEWTGAALGLLGSWMLAANNEYSGYGFAAFLLSNFCWLTFGIKTSTWGLTTMQVGFMASSVVGLYNWLGIHNWLLVNHWLPV